MSPSLSHRATCIAVRDDVRRCLTERPLRWLRAGHRVEVMMTVPGSNARRGAEARMNFWLSVCGCQFGALAFLGTLTEKVWSLAQAPAWTGVDVISIVLTPVLAAVATKFATLVLSRLAFGCELLVLLRIGDSRPFVPLRRSR